MLIVGFLVRLRCEFDAFFRWSHSCSQTPNKFQTKVMRRKCCSVRQVSRRILHSFFFGRHDDGALADYFTLVLIWGAYRQTVVDDVCDHMVNQEEVLQDTTGSDEPEV